MARNPWAGGPTELIEHAISHMAGGSPFDHRIALISVDNAVELIARTYLQLPERVRGGKGPSTKEYQDGSKSFPALLTMLGTFGEDRLVSIDLGDIEYYHRIRNKLYHDSMTLSADPSDVDAYLQIARLLMKNLLTAPLPEVGSERPATARGRFLLAWDELLDRLFDAADKIVPRTPMTGRSVGKAVNVLRSSNILTDQTMESFLRISSVRNAAAHGNEEMDKDELSDVISDLYSLIGELRFAARSLKEVEPLPQSPTHTPEVRELLVAALPKGEFMIMEIDQLPGPWVRVGRRDFLDEGDPAVAAKYLEAFEFLLREGLVKRISSHLHVLTGSGFEAARAISS